MGNLYDASTVLNSIKYNLDAIKTDCNNDYPYSRMLVAYLKLHLSCPQDPCAEALLVATFTDYINCKGGCMK